MCNEIMHAMPDTFHWISERFKKQDTCKRRRDIAQQATHARVCS